MGGGGGAIGRISECTSYLLKVEKIQIVLIL